MLRANDLLSLHNFFSREYRMRSLWCTVDRNAHAAHLLMLHNWAQRNIPKKRLPDLAKVDPWIDRLLDMHFLESDTRGNWTVSTDVFREKFIQKVGGNGIDFLFDFLRRVERDENFIQSLYYFFDLSKKYGVYATHLDSFAEKDYPIADFDPQALNDICEEEFPQELSVESSNSYRALNKSEFAYEFENTSGGNNENALFTIFHAFLVNIDHPLFDLETILKKIKKDLTVYAIQSKVTQGVTLTEKENDILAKALGISRQTFHSRGAQNRLIGLKMWDLIHMKEVRIKKEAYEELQRRGDLFGVRPVCAENGDSACLPCIGKGSEKSSCYKYSLELLKFAENSILADPAESMNNK